MSSEIGEMVTVKWFTPAYNNALEPFQVARPAPAFVHPAAIELVTLADVRAARASADRAFCWTALKRDAEMKICHCVDTRY
jgi:hypothetical protein